MDVTFLGVREEHAAWGRTWKRAHVWQHLCMGGELVRQHLCMGGELSARLVLVGLGPGSIIYKMMMNHV